MIVALFVTGLVSMITYFIINSYNTSTVVGKWDSPLTWASFVIPWHLGLLSFAYWLLYDST